MAAQGKQNHTTKIPIVFVHDFGDGNGPVPAHRHLNPDGSLGGMVADTARVASTVTVGPDALVYGMADVHDQAMILDRAQVYGDASIMNKATICGSARVHGCAWVFDQAVVGGNAQVFDNAQLGDAAYVAGWARVYGDAIVHFAALTAGEFTEGLIGTIGRLSPGTKH